MQGKALGPGFRKVWVAAAISNLGDGLVLAALPLLAESLTKTAVLVSGIVTMRYAAWLVLGLLGGVVADRADRRWVMVIVDVGRTLVVAVLGLEIALGSPPIAALWLAAFLLGCGEVFFDSAAQAMLPSLIGDDELLERANSRLYVAQSVTTDLIGPPVGAFLFAAVAALPFLIDAGSFAAAALIVATLVGSFRVRRATSAAATENAAVGDASAAAAVAEPRPSMRAELTEAWRYVRSQRLLRSLIALGCAWNFFAIGALSTNVLFARRVLHVSPAGYGFVLTGFAVGGVIAGLVTERITARIGPGTTILLTFLLGGLSGLVSAISQNAVVFALGFGISFAAGSAASIVVVTLRQQLVPDALRGRVNAFFRVAIFAAAALGGIAMGILGSAVSLRAPLIALGIAGVALFGAGLGEISNGRIARARDAAREVTAP